MSTIEQISRGRSAFLLLAGVAFATWQLTEFNDIAGAMSESKLPLIGSTALTVFIVAVVAILAPIFSRPKLAIEDELTRQNRHRVFTWGYCLTIGATVIALFVASNMSVSTEDLLRAVLIVGLSVPLIGFALMERACLDDR